jgi:hypothetical protein
MSKEAQLKDLHEEALEQFDCIKKVMEQERFQCLEDRRFYSIAGAQWEGLTKEFENKPRFEFNKVHLSVIRIINEYKNNRITVNFVSKVGDKDDETADICAQLYRSDEQYSTAQEAYDNAFEEAVGGGFGAWRLRTCYEDEEDEDNDHQRIMIEPITDADTSVFFDLDAKRYDKSDAQHAFIIHGYTKERYEREFGKESNSSIDKMSKQTSFDWYTPDVVYIAEYYVVEEKKETLEIYEDKDGKQRRHYATDFEDDPMLYEELKAYGFERVKEKKIKKRKVRKLLIDGSDVLEDCGYIAGDQIPIVPVYGKRWFIDGVERCMGHVRLAKDPQRLKNMQISKIAHIASLGSVEKPIFAPEQIAGFDNLWAEDNVKNYPYLLANPLVDQNGNFAALGALSYTKAPEIPSSTAALVQLTETDMQDILGNQQQGEEMLPNQSGRAIELIQNKIDKQAYIYLDNMAKSIKRGGEIWLSMGREIFVEKNRKMRGVGEQGDYTEVELLKPSINKTTGDVEYLNDITSSKFDVEVTVGPQSDSARQTTVRNILGVMQLSQDPDTNMVLTATAIRNMDGEGLRGVREYYRKKLIRLGVESPNDKDIEELEQEAQNRQPDPQAMYLQASAQQASAQAEKAQADTVLTKTAVQVASMNLEERRFLMQELQNFNNGQVETKPTAEVVEQPQPFGV